jgi:hypothetical protein
LEKFAGGEGLGYFVWSTIRLALAISAEQARYLGRWFPGMFENPI